MRESSLRVLMITSEWPVRNHPERGVFVAQQVKDLRKAGVAVTVFPFHGNKNPVNYLRSWVRLRRQHNISKFDVVHAQFGQSGLLTLPPKIPLVVTFHGSDLQGFLGSNGRYTVAGSLLQFVSRYVARRANQIIIVSEHLAKYIPNRLPVHVIPCGVDLDLFRPMPAEDARRQLDLPLDKSFVLFAANPDNPIKRYTLAKEAVALLKSRFDVELVTVYRASHDLIPLYMNACDVLILTSAHEGSPTVIKEALACNLPVVSVDVGDVCYRIGNIPGCIVCADDSPERISEGLAEVLQVRERISSRESISDLDEREIVKQIIEVYRAAVNKGSVSLCRKGHNFT